MKRVLKTHGGPQSQGRRKGKRPLSKSRPLRLSLKSSKAQNALSMKSVKHKIWIAQLLKRKAAHFGVRIEWIQNSGQQLDLLVRTTSRLSFQKFLKSTTALIARQVTGARRGRPFGKFWDHLAFSQILTRLDDFEDWLSAIRQIGVSSGALMRLQRAKNLWNSSS